MSIQSIAVPITSFNRRELTLRTLASLYSQKIVANVRLSVYLVDDGRTDGTGEAVRSQFPDVNILPGDGSLFWNGGMRKAFAEAMQGNFDAYLFLNDDTILYEDALERALNCARSWNSVGASAIVVGSTRSPITGDHSYGGIARRLCWLELTFEKVLPHSSSSTPCDTMNGNFALTQRDYLPLLSTGVSGNLQLWLYAST